MLDNYKNCTGCSACINACPNNALEFGCDEYGFYKPKIIKDNCINCGLCKAVYSMNNLKT